MITPMAENPLALRARPVAVALMLGLAPACSQGNSPAPTQPTQPTQSSQAVSFAGVWTVTSQVTVCEGVYYCSAYLKTPESVVLRLTQSGARVLGAFVDQNQEWVGLEGSVDKEGVLRLSGESRESALGFCGGGVTLSDLTLRMTAQNGSFGSYEWRDARPPSCLTPYNPTYRGHVTHKVTRVTSIERTDASAAPETFGGAWWGHALEVCEGPPVPRCIFPRGHASYGQCSSTMLCQGSTDARLHFDLTDSGGPLGGTLRVATLDPDNDDMTVGGTASGGRLQLSASRTRRDTWGEWETRVTDSLLRTDELGRLTGTFAVVGEFRRTDGEVYSWRKGYSLANVVYIHR